MTRFLPHCLVICALSAGPLSAGDELADAELKQLAGRAAGTGGRDQLWSDLLTFGRKYPGTPQAVQAAGLLRDLPSPLDRLDPAAIPALEKFPWHPKETVAVLGEHRGRQGGAVTAVQFSRNGKWLVSTSTNGHVRLWDPTTMRLQHTLGNASGTASLSISKDNTLLAVGGGNGTVRVWDMTAPEKPKAKGNFKVTSTGITGLALAPNNKWFVAAGADSRVYLWDLSTDPPREFSGAHGHSAAAHTVAYSPDGKTIASGGADKMIRLWIVTAMNQMKEKTSIEAHAGTVHCLAYHPTDDKTLISGGTDGIRVWAVGAKLTPRFALKGKIAVHGIAFSLSGKTVAAAYADGTVRTFNFLGNGALAEKAVLEGHTAKATGVSFAPDGQTLASGSADWTVRLWPAVSGPRPRDKTIAGGHLSHVYTMAFAPDGAGLASGSYDRTVRLWDIQGAELNERTPTLKSDAEVHTLAWAPDGKGIAAAGDSPKLRTFDVAGGQLKTLAGHKARITRLTYSPDGKYLASASLDKSIRLWNPRSGEGETAITTFDSYVNCVAFSPDGKQLACASGHYLYDKNKQIVSKDGGNLFNDSTIRVYEVGTFKELYRWKYDRARMTFITFAPDSRKLYAGASDVLLRQWDAASPAKEPETVYKGTGPGINFMTCSPDGRWLATHGPDYRINLFDRATGKKVRDIILGEAYGNLAFAPDSRHLAVAVGTGLILVLRLEEIKK